MNYSNLIHSIRYKCNHLMYAIKLGIFAYRKTYQWDSYYSLPLLAAYKLRQTAKYFRTKGHLLHANSYARQMEVTAFLMERWSNNEYIDKELDEHYEKWPSHLLDDEYHKPWVDKDGNILGSRYTYKPSEEEYEDHKRIWYLEIVRRSRDEEAILRLMRKYMRHWCD